MLVLPSIIALAMSAHAERVMYGVLAVCMGNIYHEYVLYR